ncbi:MAG TPA: tRNA 2-thiouridine(34) synthase MnmA [Terriglobales bacterium]|nr:tRNA 2-thiouridine(34) synthase MnmA [Terriglobales bacterium]
MSDAPIAVAMSGGVDSSTVAAILHAEGIPIVGLTMQLWNQRRLAGAPGMGESRTGRCCSLDDVHDARRVAERLGIPYYVVNYEERFERDVVRTFVDQYLAGRTPIPCSLCNTAVKFDQLLITARQIGAEKVATGHYARVRVNSDTGVYELWRGVDEGKDQTFFLWGLTQEQLSRAVFPLGEMRKPAVRARATELGLAVADKPDSNEICFVPGNDYAAFLKAYAAEQGMPLPDTSGELVTGDGRSLGSHGGIHRFTVGQRKGLGLATQPGGGGTALYVINIDAATRQVRVGEEAELHARELTGSDCHWISGEPAGAAVRVEARIRNRHVPAPAWAEPLAGRRLRVCFDEPQRAVTPGQSVVLYQGEKVLGGAWIDSRA